MTRVNPDIPDIPNSPPLSHPPKLPRYKLPNPPIPQTTVSLKNPDETPFIL